MSAHGRVVDVVCVVGLAVGSMVHAQTAPATPVTDQQVYGAWRAWITTQPPLYLAQQGWKVTGFDPAEKAVAAAQAEAQRLGVSLRTSIVGDEEFDSGRNQWDLIVLSYVGVQPRRSGPRGNA